MILVSKKRKGDIHRKAGATAAIQARPTWASSTEPQFRKSTGQVVYLLQVSLPAWDTNTALYYKPSYLSCRSQLQR